MQTSEMLNHEAGCIYSTMYLRGGIWDIGLREMADQIAVLLPVHSI